MKMTAKTVKCIVFAAVMCIAGGLRAADGGEVIWWLVEDMGKITAEKDGVTYNAAAMGVNAARVRYQSGEERGYLSIYASVNNEVHLTMGNGSAASVPGEYFAALGGLPGESYSFVVELGNWADGSWTGTAMESASATYSELQKMNAVATWHDTTPVYSQPWKPSGFTVVPEPNSGLMLLIGGALLALRRRRSGKDC